MRRDVVAARCAQVAREQRRAQPVRRVVRERDRVIEIVGDERREHRAEQLVLRERRVARSTPRTTVGGRK